MAFSVPDDGGHCLMHSAPAYGNGLRCVQARDVEPSQGGHFSLIRYRGVSPRSGFVQPDHPVGKPASEMDHRGVRERKPVQDPASGPQVTARQDWGIGAGE
jgi:hypothetical protein